MLPARYEHLYIKSKTYPRNRLWRPIGVFPVRYGHYLLIKEVRRSP
jgi:hypothetical protein